MPWFRVDDQLHNHRKSRNVLRSDATKRRDVAPMGLWALAGSWCGQNRTNGFIPADLLEDWDDDAQTLASRLVEAGLWREDEVAGELGYRFHDWAERNPTGSSTAAKDATKESSRGSYANHVRWHENRGKKDPNCPLCNPPESPDEHTEIVSRHSEDPNGIRTESEIIRTDTFGSVGSLSDLCSDTVSRRSETENRRSSRDIPTDSERIDDIPPLPVPDPHKDGGYVSRERYDAHTRAIANDPPPARCPRHPNGTADACGDCRAARLASEAQTERNRTAAADARRAEREAEATTKAAAITECGLCDDNGYRGRIVCDHIDHEPAAARGRAKIRAELDAIAARKSA